MARWVADASPLYLAELDRLDLLQNGAEEILIPPRVFRETQASLRNAPAIWVSAAFVSVGRLIRRLTDDNLFLEYPRGTSPWSSPPSSAD